MGVSRWTPGFVRLGLQTMATLIPLGQHRRLYRDFKGKTDTKSALQRTVRPHEYLISHLYLYIPTST
jgi:hypothetical protein